MVVFEPGGPRRYAHQRQVLRRIIETRGVCALLCDPGTGKTAPAIDYLGLLTLKSQTEVGGIPEARALVIAPKVAVDTWVLQAETFASPQIEVWAEALGGSIVSKAETLISRGPAPYRPRAVRRSKDAKQLPYRALNSDRSELIYSTTPGARGPSELVSRPRLILEAMNFDALSSRARRGSGTVADYLVQAVERFQPDIIIIDESHRIKGVGSNVSRLAARLSGLVPRRLILTGTVMPHSPMDVFAQWRFLKPTAFGDIDHRTGKRRNATYAGFQRRYGVMGGFMGREVVAFRNLDDMQAIMAENSVVVKKEDALDLPDTTDAVIPIVLSSPEQKAYDGMKKNLAAQLGTGQLTAANRLTQMLRLRQITAGHLPDDAGTVNTIGSTKVDAIAGLAHDTLAGENRIVIFASFRHEIAALRDALARSGTEVLVIDGSTSESHRREMRRRFGDTEANPGRLILIAQVQTISLAVNELVTASHAIFATLSQRRDDLVQARDRLNRIGQTRKMTFWYPLARGTIDEVVFKSHQERTNLEAAILRHVQNSR